MKVTRTMRCWMAMLLLCIGVSPVLAQKNIDKLVKELEKRTDVAINSVTKRDPKTRKVVSMIKTYSVKDEKMSFVKAFEMDEEDAITAIKDLPKGRANIKDAKLTFIFSSKEDEMRTYTLEVSRAGVVTLTVVVKQVKNGGDLSFWEMDNFFNSSEGIVRFNQLKRKWDKADELGCAIEKDMKMDKKLNALGITMSGDKVTLRKDGALVLQGDVRMNGKRLGKGTHRIRGHRVIVR